MLCKLLAQMDRERFANRVVSLTDEGELAATIERMGIPVAALRIDGMLGAVRGVVSLANEIRTYAPHVVQTWLHHADLLGLLASRLAGRKQVVWNLRCAELNAAEVPQANLRLVGLLSRLSTLPQAIVANSRAGLEAHCRAGYRPRRSIVIPNGFDLEQFRPDAQARDAVRGELGVGPGTVVIGMIGRYHPMKAQGLFLDAVAEILGKRDDVLAVMAGDGVDDRNEALLGRLGELGITGRVRLLGFCRDVPSFMAALDLLVSSSTSEGFPNVVGEAMAVGVPCVVTDVGDCREIVGEAGYPVPSGDAAAIAAACNSYLDLNDAGRIALSTRARERIAANYSIGRVTERYQDLYAGLAMQS